MMRATFTGAFLCSVAAAAPLVTFESPCECRDNHGKGRVPEKDDLDAVTHSDAAFSNTTLQLCATRRPARGLR